MNNPPQELIRLILELNQAGASCAFALSSQVARKNFDGTLDVTCGDLQRRFLFEHKRRAPYRSELEQFEPLRSAAKKLGEPLLLVPRVGAGLAKALVENGWSWADACGNYDLRARGLRLRQIGRNAPAEKPHKLPGGPAAGRVIRWLITGRERHSVHVGISALAGLVGVSQPGASRIIKELRMLDFVSGKRGLGDVDRAGLLYAFADQYSGPGGAIEHGYSLDSPVELAATFEAKFGDSIAISADVGPDRLAPWRVPTSLIVYARVPIDPDELGIVPARGPIDANIVIQYPEDPNVFVRPELAPDHTRTLADPVQMYIDLRRLGGEDRLEAQARLEQWILK